MRKIALLGLGRIGTLTGRLLQDAGFDVVGIDGKPKANHPFPVHAADVTRPGTLGPCLAGADAVLSCLPYSLNRAVAQAACEAGIHYFDLTEDVPTTEAIRELARTSKGVMAPQCGLAPGFVGIVAAAQAHKFDSCRSIRMRVGALPRNPTGLLGYAFNWSPEGVVNEYLNDCEVIEDGVRKTVSSMEWIEQVYVKGVHLEAFTTSGGLGTMCESFLGKVDNLDYKTMRYPGHAALMNFFFHELLMRERRQLAGEILTAAKPPVADDVVYVHVSAEGQRDGRLWREEFVEAYYPREFHGEHWTAIAWTTSASVVAVLEMLRDGKLCSRGFLKQEEIDFEQFLTTRSGALFLDTA